MTDPKNPTGHPDIHYHFLPKVKNNAAQASRVSTGKEMLVLLRDAFLFMALLVFAIFFICWPEKIGERFTNAGISEIAGIKIMQKQVVTADNALSGLKGNIQLLKGQLEGVKKFLDTAKDITSDDRFQRGQEIVSALKISDSSLKIIDKTITSDPAFVKLVNEAQQKTNEGYDWGVVFSADIDTVGAIYEQRRAIRLGIADVTIYRRQGYFRSVATTDTRSKAEAILKTIKSQHPDAYIVPMSTWCADSKSRITYEECLSK